jgi:hypothetical protein
VIDPASDRRPRCSLCGLGDNWRETFHEFTRGDWLGRCELCGATASRAVHSKDYADQNGYEFVAAIPDVDAHREDA